MNTERMALSTNYAVAYAAKACDVDVVAVYPITPQVEIGELFGQFVANGEVNTEYVPVESEHSAISACMGASASGARAFTATASQGLALMHECLFIASGSRLPIVMVVTNRTLSAPINIHCDHSDALSSRDCGWIQFYVSSAQEAYDSLIQAYKIAENKDVLLPVMICYDGYLLSHTYEPVLINKDEDIRKFVPNDIDRMLNPDNPASIGSFCMPNYEYEFKYQIVEALGKVPSLSSNVDKEFGETFDRKYGLFETYRCDDAEIIMVSMGTIASTARVAVDELRMENKKVGLFRPRLFRPNPTEEWRNILSNANSLMVVDRSIGYGTSVSPLMHEILGTFMNETNRPQLSNFSAGIGGRDVTVNDIKKMFHKTIDSRREGQIMKKCEYYGVRE
jgi:pyruvate ferredoxin oxidoreductase alpha subunit